MSSLPPYKIIEKCCKCPATKTPGRKIGKDTFCLRCYNNKKSKELQSKSNLKYSIAGNNKKSNLELSSSEWFTKRMEENEPVCENCEAEMLLLKLNPGLSKQWRSCQAHLLPKKYFESVSTHELNGMVLGTGFSGLCFCHDDFDSSWEKASKMKIWPEVIRRFKIMYSLLTPSETKYIPNVLLKELSEEDIGWKDMESRLDEECSQNSDTENVL